MGRIIQVRLSPAEAARPEAVERAVRTAVGVADSGLFTYAVRKRSIDARGRTAMIALAVYVPDTGETNEQQVPDIEFRDVRDAPEVHIVGAGPAGLFAALRLLELGLKPIILERGKPVKERRRDLATLIKTHRVDPDSNYCFGEGGAGTYSDGKLYTRSSKRGDVGRIMRLFVRFGADADILIDAHPHIGTNKLPGIIERMRETIIAHGGEVRFGMRVTDLALEAGRVTGVVLNGTLSQECRALILATGHSASDMYYLLHAKGVALEAKDFALGVRVEHPQHVIDSAFYHCEVRDPHLPPAAYSLVEQVRGAGVYSFCMCPGGIIAPCATTDGEVVTNGWSPSKRNNPYANSGIVVTVDARARNAFEASGPLAGLKYREFVEQTLCRAAGGTQRVPGQRLTDFVAGSESAGLPECSYLPGVVPARLDLLLPPDIVARLREAFVAFGKRIPGYLHPDAMVVGPESRTSAPVRIPRTESGAHPDVAGLYPCGEGAGYAGGIVSAAMDGERMADAVAAAVREGAIDVSSKR